MNESNTQAPSPSQVVPSTGYERGRDGRPLALAGVTRRFGDDVHVLDGIDLSVPAGQFLAILGPSGCGKSTLLRLVAALDGADSGSLTLSGREIHKRRHPAADAIAFVFQQAQLLPWRTLVRNVELPLELSGTSAAERRDRAMALIEQVGLADAATRYPAELSGGMKMRASLARALITEPDLLLLDEPFAALDEITRQRLDAQLYELWRQRRFTVLFVTHSIREAVFLAERVIMLTRRPASICADREIDLPAARDLDIRGSSAFNEYVRVLHGDLKIAEGSP